MNNDRLAAHYPLLKLLFMLASQSNWPANIIFIYSSIQKPKSMHAWRCLYLDTLIMWWHLLRKNIRFSKSSRKINPVSRPDVYMSRWSTLGDVRMTRFHPLRASQWHGIVNIAHQCRNTRMLTSKPLSRLLVHYNTHYCGEYEDFFSSCQGNVYVLRMLLNRF